MSNLNKYIISYIVLVLTICSVHAIPNNINKRYDSDETKCNDFCQKSKLPLANFSSEQLTGFCSSTVIGEVPSTAHLPSILITKPSYGEIIQLNKDFIFEFKYVNFEPGAVANLSTEFDRYPQSIHEEGNIIGHYHMTIQKIPSPDA
ncbi:24122_t:CDS:1, partial [Gigaspora rosea]